MTANRRLRQFLALLLAATLAVQAVAMSRLLPCHQLGGMPLPSSTEHRHGEDNARHHHPHGEGAAGHEHATKVSIDRHHVDKGSGDIRAKCAACASCGLCAAIIPVFPTVTPPPLIAARFAAISSPPPSHHPTTFDRPPRA